jgi:serine/threonine protein phosphatase 1
LQLLNISATKEFAVNKRGHDYFIGDIHGHHRLLKVQLEKLDFNFERDRLFAVGDIIDRGSESEKCLELLVEPWFNSVLGNHEYLFLQGFSNPSCWQLLIENGGQWLNKWLDKPSQLLSWAHLIRIMMPLSLSVKTEYGMIGLTHADSPENWQVLKNINMCNIFSVIWQRQNFSQQNKSVILGIDATFHGHNQVGSVSIVNNQIWADTLQCTGQLTILSAYDVFTYIRNNNL